MVNIRAKKAIGTLETVVARLLIQAIALVLLECWE